MMPVSYPILIPVLCHQRGKGSHDEVLHSQDDLPLYCQNSPKSPPTRRVRSYIIHTPVLSDQSQHEIPSSSINN